MEVGLRTSRTVRKKWGMASQEVKEISSWSYDAEQLVWPRGALGLSTPKQEVATRWRAAFQKQIGRTNETSAGPASSMSRGRNDERAQAEANLSLAQARTVRRSSSSPDQAAYRPTLRLEDSWIWVPAHPLVAAVVRHPSTRRACCHQARGSRAVGHTQLTHVSHLVMCEFLYEFYKMSDEIDK